MNRLHLQFFGTFAAQQAETPCAALQCQPALQLLLAYLALHPGTALPRTQIAFTLWPDTSEARARANLRQSLYTLRTLLNATLPLNVDHQTVTLTQRSDLAVDLWSFSACLAEKSPSTAHLQLAVELYRGDLLAGCYADWLLPFRKHYQAQYQQALERLSSHAERQGAIDDAIALTRRLLASDPYQERIVSLLMQRLLRGGDRAAALACYDQLQRLLENDLGSTPLP